MMTEDERKDALDWARRKRDDCYSSSQDWMTRGMPAVAAALAMRGNRFARLIKMADTSREVEHVR